jgi:hypothetical protein
MALRRQGDPAGCTWCGQPLDLSYELAEYGVCQACTRKIDDAFIAGFGLREGEHYENSPAGDVEYWLGDVTVCAGGAFLKICERTGAWEDVPLADLVRRTREFLAYYHGPLSAPFGDPDA